MLGLKDSIRNADSLSALLPCLQDERRHDTERCEHVVTFRTVDHLSCTSELCVFTTADYTQRIIVVHSCKVSYNGCRLISGVAGHIEETSSRATCAIADNLEVRWADVVIAQDVLIERNAHVAKATRVLFGEPSVIASHFKLRERSEVLCEVTQCENIISTPKACVNKICSNLSVSLSAALRYIRQISTVSIKSAVAGRIAC